MEKLVNRLSWKYSVDTFPFIIMVVICDLKNNMWNFNGLLAVRRKDLQVLVVWVLGRHADWNWLIFWLRTIFYWGSGLQTFALCFLCPQTASIVVSWKQEPPTAPSAQRRFVNPDFGHSSLLSLQEQWLGGSFTYLFMFFPLSLFRYCKNNKTKHNKNRRHWNRHSQHSLLEQALVPLMQRQLLQSWRHLESPSQVGPSCL